jgi:hypothetical protein
VRFRPCLERLRRAVNGDGVPVRAFPSFTDYLREADRILKLNGWHYIIEATRRFDNKRDRVLEVYALRHTFGAGLLRAAAQQLSVVEG